MNSSSAIFSCNKIILISSNLDLIWCLQKKTMLWGFEGLVHTAESCDLWKEGRKTKKIGFQICLHHFYVFEKNWETWVFTFPKAFPVSEGWLLNWVEGQIVLKSIQDQRTGSRYCLVSCCQFILSLNFKKCIPLAISWQMGNACMSLIKLKLHFTHK